MRATMAHGNTHGQSSFRHAALTRDVNDMSSCIESDGHNARPDVYMEHYWRTWCV